MSGLGFQACPHHSCKMHRYAPATGSLGAVAWLPQVSWPFRTPCAKDAGSSDAPKLPFARVPFGMHANQDKVLVAVTMFP